jgi:hypothetical protein
MIKQMIDRINPYKLFLVDGLGAMNSAVMLGLVLARFEKIFGMPTARLYPLAFLALLFSFYSFGCFVIKPQNWKPYLKAIAIVNLLYCTLTLFLISYLHQKLTPLGLIYFILEIMVVTLLAGIELKTAFRNE